MAEPTFYTHKYQFRNGAVGTTSGISLQGVANASKVATVQLFKSEDNIRYLMYKARQIASARVRYPCPPLDRSTLEEIMSNVLTYCWPFTERTVYEIIGHVVKMNNMVIPGLAERMEEATRSMIQQEQRRNWRVIGLPEVTNVRTESDSYADYKPLTISTKPRPEDDIVIKPSDYNPSRITRPVAI